MLNIQLLIVIIIVGISKEFIARFSIIGAKLG